MSDRRYDITIVQPGEPGPSGYEQYGTLPDGRTQWRKDLTYPAIAPPFQKRKRKGEPPVADDSDTNDEDDPWHE